MKDHTIEMSYAEARKRFQDFGVDADAALKKLEGIPLSLHCWQGDDVGGFEKPDASLSGGGIQVTGKYPGRARNIDELRADLETAYSLIPGKHRLNLHAIYGDFAGKKIERDKLQPKHFQTWVDWAREHGLGLDFNATCFSHPKAESGYTLCHGDEPIRKFWVEHVQRCREISDWIGGQLGSPCLHNLWIPDGSKDVLVGRMNRREILKKSLEEIYSVTYPNRHMKDSVESKLFGIGSESFVAGSHDFYLPWALSHGKMLCVDMGHFHPTESVADKVSSLLLFFDEVLFHVSRGVRWDSDHVVIFNDELKSLMEEIVRADALSRVHFALDYFDAEMNRVGAWVVGARSTLKALSAALLEPTAEIRRLEEKGDHFGKLALMEESRLLPHGAVWDYYCLTKNVPSGADWISKIRDYEKRVLSKR